MLSHSLFLFFLILRKLTHFDILFLEPLHNQLRGVLGIVVLLELPSSRAVSLGPGNHFFLHDLLVVFFLHNALDPNKRSDFTSDETSPDHDTASSMLDSGDSVLGVESLVDRSMDVLHTFGEEFELALVSPEYMRPLSGCPIEMFSREPVV